MIPFSMILNDPQPSFQGHAIIRGVVNVSLDIFVYVFERKKCYVL